MPRSPAVRPHPALQSRSQNTLERLLDAAEMSLARDGLEMSTVPGIAAAAGVAVGTVYRRFPDKDALLRAVYERFFERTRVANQAALMAEVCNELSARDIVASYALGMINGYRRHHGLLRALLAFAEQHSDARFRAQARVLSEEGLRGLETLLLARRDEMAHGDAETIRFALMTFAITARGILIANSGKSVPFAGDPPRLASELTRMMARYLGIEDVGIDSPRP